LSGGLHPHYAETVETVAGLAGTMVRAPVTPGKAEDIIALIDEDTACVVVQSPDVFGLIRNLRPIADAAHAKGALLVAVVTEIVSLGLLESPGAQGADIVAAEGQGIGNGLNFGGPYVGLFATREKFLRQMPGRLTGETVDAAGRRGYVLTLSTREQHIRREKATSNICTNSGLCTLAFTIHLSLLGEEGFTRLARLNHAKASALADRLGRLPGVSLATPSFFNEFTLRLPKPAAPIVDALAAKGVLGGVPASRLLPHDDGVTNLLIVAATETNMESDFNAFAASLEEIL
jgi:glycine dehydrogenase subunit 1